MSRSSSIDRGVRIVDRLGIALVYPVEGKVELRSLWSELYPKVKMEWSWDEDADPRVAEVWHLRERLARSHDVAYAKWFRGRATLFSLPVFHAMLGRFAAAGDVSSGLPDEATRILELLRERSPMSTKEIRAASDLRGKEHESVFTHAMKALWSRLLVVGTGEVPDGAFPSLAVGATELLFEDLWSARRKVSVDAARQLDAVLRAAPAYERELKRALDAVARPQGKTAHRQASKVSLAAYDAALDESVPRARRRGAKQGTTETDPPFTEPTRSEVFGASSKGR